MSTEDQHKIIGRLVSERQEAKQQAEFIKQRLQGIGHSMLTISQQLKEGQFETAGFNLHSFKSDIVDLSQIGKLIEDWREADDRAANLRAQLNGLGVSL